MADRWTWPRYKALRSEVRAAFWDGFKMGMYCMGMLVFIVVGAWMAFGA